MREDRKEIFGSPIENITKAVPVINTDHEAVHLGYGFSASVFAELVADDAAVYIEFKAPAASSGKVAHLKAYRPWSEGGVAKLEITEAPTLTTGSSAITPQNRNRYGTPAVSVSTLKSNPTSISAGTIIDGPIPVGGGGAGGGFGGNLSNDQELVFDPGKTYLLTVTNLAGSAKALGLWIFWYEEPA